MNDPMLQKIASDYSSVPLKSPSVSSNPYHEGLMDDPGDLGAQHPMNRGNAEEVMRKIMRDEMRKKMAPAAPAPMTGAPPSAGAGMAGGLLSGVQGYQHGQALKKLGLIE